MTDSGDGLYMFIGHTRGIVVIDANTQERVTAWEEDRVDLQHIKAHIMAPNIYLLVTIDDMGMIFVYIYILYIDSPWLVQHIGKIIYLICLIS